MGLVSSQLSFLSEEGQSLPRDQQYYLFLVKKNMRDTFLTIEKNPNNIRIATEKKNFERTMPMRMSNNPSSVLNRNMNINWKDYLISYFRKQEEKDINWYGEIRVNIENEAFLRENYYLSDMFYKTYEMQMRPSCLIGSDKIIEPIDQFEVIAEKFVKQSVSRKSSVKSTTMENKLDLTHVTENLGGSFCDSDEVIDVGVYDKSVRDILKDYLKIFKTHVLELNHPINIVIQIFEAKVSNVINNKIAQLKSMKTSKDPEYASLLDDVCDAFVHVIQKFVIKTQSAFKLMYASTLNMQCFFEEKDEIVNLVCSVLFSTGSIYEKMYELFSMQLKKSLAMFEEKITQLSDVTPKDIGINVKFCLDESTMKFKQEIYETERKKKLSNPNANTIVIPQLNQFSINYDEEIKQSNIIKLSESKERVMKTESSLASPSSHKAKRSKVKVYADFHKTNPIEGYNTAITILRSIKFNRVPFEKMMLLASVSTEITDCINSFWSGMDQYLPPGLLCLNSDDIMYIYIFLVIKAQMPELLVQERIIEKFTTNKSRSTTMGYYTTVLEGSLEYIERKTIKGIGVIQSVKKKSNKEKEIKNKNEKDDHITISPFSIER